MRRFVVVFLLVLVVLAGLVAAEARADAWPARRAWTDRIAPADADSPTYAEAYPGFVREAAPAWVAEGIRLDCADFSITLLVEYAARHELPLSFRHFSATGGVDEARAQSATFTSKEQYAKFVRSRVNAMMLATFATRAIGYDEWTSGDHIFMDWNQSDVEPNFPGRSVWHTYVVGTPDESVFYGNLDQGEPLPIVESRSPVHLERVRAHPDRYSAGPRRFDVLVFRPGFEVPPGAIATADEARFVAVDRLPLRRGPGPARAADLRLARGAPVRLTGRWRDFARVEVPAEATGGRGPLTGFVAESFLAGAAPAGPETFARVTVASANVRLGPGLAHVVVERLRSGDRVKVLARSGSWSRVATPTTLDSPDLERWISTSLLADEPPPKPTGVVTAGLLNVRSGPGTSHAVVTRVAAGRRLEILEERPGWLRVRWEGAPPVAALWCSAAYVRRE